MLDNQLKKQAQMRESILAGVVILAICYMSYINFYTPKKESADLLATQIDLIQEKKSGIEKLNRALRKKYDEQRQEMIKQANLAATQDPNLKLIKEQKKPIFKNVTEFLSTVTKIDFRAKVNINSMRYDSPMMKTGYSETKFFLKVNGTFGSVIEFIEKMEAVPALVSLDKINIQVSKNDANMVTLDLNGTFYQLGS